MKADLIDVFMEELGDEVVIHLRGTLGVHQLAAVREKLEMLVSGPGKFWFLDLDRARFTEREYLELFLDILNLIRKKEATLVLLFDNQENKDFFERYYHVFEIYPSRKAYHQSGILKQLKQAGVTYRKQTGLRLSPGITLFFLVILTGWFLTLFSMIQKQENEIKEGQAQVMELEMLRNESIREIDELRAAIGPLRNLGLVLDSSESFSYGRIRDWIAYLELLEARRRGD